MYIKYIPNMFLLFLWICSSLSSIAPLEEASFYIVGIGKVEYQPSGCVHTRECPNERCLRCNLTTTDSCNYNDFYKIVSEPPNNVMLSLYTAIPSYACNRDTTFIDAPGYYNVLINKITIAKRSVYQLVVRADSQCDDEAISSTSSNKTIALIFTLGYEIS